MVSVIDSHARSGSIPKIIFPIPTMTDQTDATGDPRCFTLLKKKILFEKIVECCLIHILKYMPPSFEKMNGDNLIINGNELENVNNKLFGDLG